MANRIREVRMKKGLSQEYVADKLGMTQSNWSRLENGGRIDIEMLENIAKVLEVEDPLELLRPADLSIENSFNNQKECMNYFAPYLDFGKENTQKYMTIWRQRLPDLMQKSRS